MVLTLSLPPPAPHSVPDAFPSSSSSQTCTWGMGQHPQEPSSIVQHVEELGHSNWLSGHWTAPTRLVSVDRRTQDSTNLVSEDHCPHHSRCWWHQGLQAQLQRDWGTGTRAQCSPRHSQATLPQASPCLSNMPQGRGIHGLGWH